MSTSKNNPLYLFDFTIPHVEKINHIEIISILKQISKKFVFQKEKSENGYIHWQGRCSLFKKCRISSLINQKYFSGKMHWSISCKTTFKNNSFSYVMKQQTRIDGPWTDYCKIANLYIPRQYRNKIQNLRPFQAQIFNDTEFDDRKINLYLCKKGCVGKSTIANICCLFQNAIILPVSNDFERIIFSCCNILMSMNLRKDIKIFVDIPRAFTENKLNSLFTVIEVLKGGRCWDSRHKFRQYFFDSPQIYLFLNKLDSIKYLSKDRWRLYTINEEFKRVPLEFKEACIDNSSSSDSDDSDI